MNDTARHKAEESVNNKGKKADERRLTTKVSSIGPSVFDRVRPPATTPKGIFASQLAVNLVLFSSNVKKQHSGPDL